MRISDWSSDVCSSDLPAIEMVAKVPADDREGDGPMVKRDAGIDFEIIGLRKNIVDDVLVRIFQSTRYPQHVAVGKAVRIFQSRVRSEERRVGKRWVSTVRYRWSLYH